MQAIITQLRSGALAGMAFAAVVVAIWAVVP